MWDDFPVVESDETRQDWVELPENGIGAAIAWAMGPERVCRVHDTPYQHWDTVMMRATGPVTEAGREPRTATDQEMIDDAVDAYLRQLQLPDRPRGYRWFLRRPAATRDSRHFWALLNAHMQRDAGDDNHPRTVLVLVEQVLGRLYDAPPAPAVPATAEHPAPRVGLVPEQCPSPAATAELDVEPRQDPVPGPTPEPAGPTPTRLEPDQATPASGNG